MERGKWNCGSNRFCILISNINRERPSMAAVVHVKYNLLSMSQPHPIQNEHVMFITTNTIRGTCPFKEDSHAREAIECLYRVQTLYPFFLYGFVIMPNHCHFLLKVLSPSTIARVMNSYKSAVVQSIGIGKIWQARYFLEIPKNPTGTLRYINENPVHAKLSTTIQSYPWSSGSGLWDVMTLE